MRGLDGHRAAFNADIHVTALQVHGKRRPGYPHAYRAGIDIERARGIGLYREKRLAPQQRHLPLLRVELHVHQAVAVEQYVAAVAQGDVAVFSRGAVKVGAQGLPVRQQHEHRTGRDGCADQRAFASAEVSRCRRGRQHGRGRGLKRQAQRLAAQAPDFQGFAVRRVMFGCAGAPGVQLCAQFGVVRVLLNQQQPVERSLPDRVRVFRRHGTRHPKQKCGRVRPVAAYRKSQSSLICSAQ